MRAIVSIQLNILIVHWTNPIIFSNYSRCVAATKHYVTSLLSEQCACSAQSKIHKSRIGFHPIIPSINNDLNPTRLHVKHFVLPSDITQTQRQTDVILFLHCDHHSALLHVCGQDTGVPTQEPSCQTLPHIAMNVFSSNLLTCFGAHKRKMDEIQRWLTFVLCSEYLFCNGNTMIPNVMLCFHKWIISDL